MVDIYALAKETGQRPPTPEPVKHSDSEGEDDDPEEPPPPAESAADEVSEVENTVKKKRRVRL